MLNSFWGVKNGGGQGLFKDTLMKLQPQLGIDPPTEDSAEQVVKEMTDKAGPLSIDYQWSSSKKIPGWSGLYRGFY